MTDTTNTKDNYLITRIPPGFMLRKRVKGAHHQKFFGIKRFGGEIPALAAAKVERQKLIEETSDFVSVQTKNVQNKTGVVGVSFQAYKKNESLVVINVRCQMPMRDKKQSRSFSAKTHGLWPAFEMATNQRNAFLSKNKSETVNIVEAYDVFMDKYIDRIKQEEDSAIKGDLFNLIVIMLDSSNIPPVIAEITRKKLLKIVN